MIKEEGTYPAKATKATLVESKNGTAGISVEFETASDKITWTGWLSEKAIERTLKTLAETLNSNGVETVDESGVFTDPGFVDTNKEVQLVIEMEEGKNADGTTKIDVNGEIVSYPTVKWVNSGGSRFQGVGVAKSKAVLGGINFKAQFAAAKAGVTNQTPVSTSAPTDKIPF